MLDAVKKTLHIGLYDKWSLGNSTDSFGHSEFYMHLHFCTAARTHIHTCSVAPVAQRYLVTL